MRIFLMLVGFISFPVLGSLSLTQSSNEITVSSTFGKTWKVVLATAKNAGSGGQGGGTAKEVFIPKDNSSSVVQNGNGLDFFEWRYAGKNGPKARKDIANHSTITDLRVLTNTPQKIVIFLEGYWPSVSLFERTITFEPDGMTTDLYVDWDGIEEVYSMFWLIAKMKESYFDPDNAKIHDWRGGPDFELPWAAECVCPVPYPVRIPYTTKWPVRGTNDSLFMDVMVFDDKTMAGINYELRHPEEGYYRYFPRWVTSGGFQKRRYRFHWRWQLTGPYRRPAIASGLEKSLLNTAFGFRLSPNPVASGKMVRILGAGLKLKTLFNSAGQKIQMNVPGERIVAPKTAGQYWIVLGKDQRRKAKKLTVLP